MALSDGNAMTDPDRYNRVNIHHHLREDVVVLLPHVAYRNGTIGFGDGAILPRHDSMSIDRTLDPTTIGAHVSERLQRWRPRQGFFARLIA